MTDKPEDVKLPKPVELGEHTTTHKPVDYTYGKPEEQKHE